MSIGAHVYFEDANFISPSRGIYGYGITNSQSPTSSEAALKSTTDVGLNWGFVFYNSNGGNTTSIEVVRNQNTYYHLFNGHGILNVAKSQNDGITWSSTGFFGLGFSYGFSALDTSHVYLILGQGSKYIIKKYENGVSYNCDTLINEIPNDIFFADSLTGYISAGVIQFDCHMILKSISGGNNWLPVFNDPLISINKIYFVNADLGFAIGNSGKMIKTDDGGLSWNYLNTGTNINLNTVYFKNNQMGFAAGDSGLIIRTNDGGNTWLRDNTGVLGSFRRIFVMEDSIVYAIMDGAVFRSTVSMSTGLSEVVSKKIESVSVYPNPANSSVSVKLSINSPVKKISLTDIQGRKIFSLSDPESSFVLDVSSFANGVYLLKADDLQIQKVIIQH